jgi:hypothetical protein
MTQFPVPIAGPRPRSFSALVGIAASFGILFPLD